MPARTPTPDAGADGTNAVLAELRALRNDVGQVNLRMRAMESAVRAQEAAMTEVRAQLNFIKSNSKKVDSKLDSVQHGIDSSNADMRCEILEVKESIRTLQDTVTHERPAKKGRFSTHPSLLPDNATPNVAMQVTPSGPVVPQELDGKVDKRKEAQGGETQEDASTLCRTSSSQSLRRLNGVANRVPNGNSNSQVSVPRANGIAAGLPAAHANVAHTNGTSMQGVTSDVVEQEKVNGTSMQGAMSVKVYEEKKAATSMQGVTSAISEQEKTNGTEQEKENGKLMHDVLSNKVEEGEKLRVVVESQGSKSKSKASVYDVRMENGCLLSKGEEWKKGFVVRGNFGLGFCFTQECDCDDWLPAWYHQISAGDMRESTLYAVFEHENDIVVLNTAAHAQDFLDTNKQFGRFSNDAGVMPLRIIDNVNCCQQNVH